MCLPGIKPGIVLRNGGISICPWKDKSKETEGIPFISGRIGLDPKKQKEFDISVDRISISNHCPQANNGYILIWFCRLLAIDQYICKF